MALLPCEGTYDGYEDYDRLYSVGSKKRRQLEDEWDYGEEEDYEDEHITHRGDPEENHYL